MHVNKYTSTLLQQQYLLCYAFIAVYTDWAVHVNIRLNI